MFRKSKLLRKYDRFLDIFNTYVFTLMLLTVFGYGLIAGAIELYTWLEARPLEGY